MHKFYLQRFKHALTNKVELDDTLLISFMELEESSQLEKAFQLIKNVNTERKPVISIIPKILYSNYCINDCLFCPNRRYNKKLKRLRLKPEDIIHIGKLLINMGYRSLYLESGCDPSFPFAQLVQVIVNLVKKSDIKIILASGIFTFEEFAALKRAGLDSYMLSESIADPELFRIYHPFGSYLHRIRALEWLQFSGLNPCITNRIGLPYQTSQILVEDALIFRQIGISLISLEPFIPRQGTPLENKKPVSFSAFLKMIAICRLLNPESKIAVSTEIEELQEKNIIECFRIGANALFIPLDEYIDFNEDGKSVLNIEKFENYLEKMQAQLKAV